MEEKMEFNKQMKHRNAKRGGYVAGGILILVGLFSLLNNIIDIDMGVWFLVGLGLIFIVAGLVSQKRGLLIPGGIVSGVGAGVLMMEQGPWQLSEPADAGLFLLTFACGWALITLLSLFVPDENGGRSLMWWPLIPGGIMATIGGLLFAGEFGVTLLKWIGQGWPVVLIGIGLYLIFRRKELEEEK